MQALEHTYHQEWDTITIFTDSKSAIQAITNFKWDASAYIPGIIRHITNFKASGTKVRLFWIPGHAGIAGNMVADHLANLRRTEKDGSILKNVYSVPEKIREIINDHKQQMLQRIKATTTNLAVTSRHSMGILPWHTHSVRPIQSALIRLRSGHSKLNGTISKWDMDTQPNCPHGCTETENASHVLLQCPTYSTAREELKQTLEKLKYPMDVPTLTGINCSIAKHSQKKIAQKLIVFLIESKLLERI
ncbi:uncharacterized protein LOC123472431 [Daphnia magna]|uniref:uncharacterized protein LOC123472431 n=1 Tax=Daphnia magna TaxID=35525 RepID=UPI001E1BCA2C|nr:uncharacterized protein LOC123472431 [Daphnia magna]